MSDVAGVGGAGWRIVRADVTSAECAGILRDYLVDVSDRWFRLHEDRDSTPEEMRNGSRRGRRI